VPPRIVAILSDFDKGTLPTNLAYERICYIDKGREANINHGDVLKVFRERHFSGSPRPIRLFIGTLTIVEAQNGSALGAFLASPTINSPAINYRSVMKGDMVAPQLILDASLLFDSGRAILRQGANLELDRIAGFIQVFAPNKLIVEGHSDSDGNAEDNLALSQERASAVREYLVSSFEWIRPRMVDALGYGEERPRVENTTTDNKQLNRRIEFTVID